MLRSIKIAILCRPNGTLNFQPNHPDGFLLSTKCVFSPERSIGLFIEFCQHAVPSLMSCRMEANLFAYSRHGSSDAGRSPRQNVFFIFFILTPSPTVTKILHSSFFILHLNNLFHPVKS